MDKSTEKADEVMDVVAPKKPLEKGKREAGDAVEDDVLNAKRQRLEESTAQAEIKVTTSANNGPVDSELGVSGSGLEEYTTAANKKEPAVTAETGNIAFPETKDETGDKSESLCEFETSSDAVTEKANEEPELDNPKTHVIPKEQITGSKTLFVGNLSFAVEQEDVEDFFKAAGEVVSIRFGMNPDETFRGFGHVEFASAEAAVKALHELNGKELLRRRVRLDITNDRRSYAPYSSKDNQFIQSGSALKLDESEREGSALSVVEVRPRWDTGGNGRGRGGGLRGVGNSWRGGGRDFCGGRSSWRDGGNGWRGGGRDFGGGRSSWRGGGRDFGGGRSSWHDSGGKREAEDAIEEEMSNAKRQKLEENAVQDETKVTTSANNGPVDSELGVKGSGSEESANKKELAVTAETGNIAFREKNDETSAKSESLCEFETSSDAVTEKANEEPELDNPKTHVIPKEQITGSKTLFVGNLSFSVEQEDVEDFFKAAGEVVSIHFGMNPDETFRGFGHVEFASAEAADKALRELNGKELLRRPVRLDIMKDRRSYTPYSSKDNQFIQMGGRALKLDESERGGSALSVEEVRPRWDTGGSGRGRGGGLRGVGNSWRGGGRDFGGGRGGWRGGGRAFGGGSSWRGSWHDSDSSSQDQTSLNEDISAPNEAPTTPNAKKLVISMQKKDESSSFEFGCDDETSTDKNIASAEKAPSVPTKNKDESRSDVGSAGEDDVTAKNSLIVVAQKKNVSNEEAELDPKIHVTPKVQITGSKTLFVGNLSSAVKKEDLEHFFKDAEEFLNIRFGMNLAFRGFGYAEFASAEAAEKALHELKGKELMRCPVNLEFAKERRSYSPYSGNDTEPFQMGRRDEGPRIFVRGLNKFDGEDKTRSSLEEHFGSCGEITKISIPRDRFDQDGAIRGIALIHFKDDDAFNKALKLDKSKCGGNTLSVEKARPRYDTGGSGHGRGGGWSGGGGTSSWSGGELDSGGTSSWSIGGQDSGGRSSWSCGGWSSGGGGRSSWSSGGRDSGGSSSWSGDGRVSGRSSCWSSGERGAGGNSMSSGGRDSGGSSSWSSGGRGSDGNRMSSGGQCFGGNSRSGGGRDSGGSSSWSSGGRGSGGSSSWSGGGRDSGRSGSWSGGGWGSGGSGSWSGGVRGSGGSSSWSGDERGSGGSMSGGGQDFGGNSWSGGGRDSSWGSGGDGGSRGR